MPAAHGARAKILMISRVRFQFRRDGRSFTREVIIVRTPSKMLWRARARAKAARRKGRVVTP
jgi:hypothetical protein